MIIRMSCTSYISKPIDAHYTPQNYWHCQDTAITIPTICLTPSHLLDPIQYHNSHVMRRFTLNISYITQNKENY